MTNRLMAAVVCVLVCTWPVLAQSRGGKTAPDPITGTWTGELLPTGAPGGRSVTLELKHDGKGKVSGTMAGMPNPANVKAGTFDAKTGALNLQLGKTDEPAVLLVLEGKVTDKAASGRMSGEVSGEFKLTKSDK